MDIWEANSEATAYTPHVCRDPRIHRCSGNDCGDGHNRYGSVCDEDGCDFNSYRMGDKNFLGRGKTIDTTLWSDHAAHMLWLDSDYPLDKSPSEPGVSRGACATSTGNPDDVIANNANAPVTFSNINTPPVSSSGSSSVHPVTSTSSTSVPTDPTPPAGTVFKWGQCCGINYSRPTTCVAGSTCTYSNDCE
ncbi:concanavalin A-like lectin/glucanase [Pleurotus eryngii]|uniref:cellulose 1,4-beta-cellobiosidase (non-reducing end) n=1 Tax=Pleurotus eryngii TaxID=5323 RepID=A0A9P5ZT84_PLEER|nr:concanavalin A-like lectin/glucanase [Pleurotus eryngii]